MGQLGRPSEEPSQGARLRSLPETIEKPPSIYKIVLEMVNRSITYYNYEPTRDETWFTITLMYYCLRHMGLEEDVTTSFFGGLTDLMRSARKEELNEWLDCVKQY